MENFTGVCHDSYVCSFVGPWNTRPVETRLYSSNISHIRRYSSEIDFALGREHLNRDEMPSLILKESPTDFDATNRRSAANPEIHRVPSAKY
jgi:hypothetical protein